MKAWGNRIVNLFPWMAWANSMLATINRLNSSHFLVTLSKSDDIKIGVSSRHYPIFQAKFKGFPTLKFENLTRNDIRTFVEGELGDLKDFKLLH